MMTRQEKIEQLQDWVSKNQIRTLDDLKYEISCAEYQGDEPIDEWDDVLSPMEWNVCDRCGELWKSEELFWLEYAEDLDISDNLRRGLEQEDGEYTTLCEDCVKKLVEEGKH